MTREEETRLNADRLYAALNSVRLHCQPHDVSADVQRHDVIVRLTSWQAKVLADHLLASGVVSVEGSL